MEVTISKSKRGDSGHVYIPEDILTQSGLKEDSRVEIHAEEGKVILSQSAPPPKRRKYTMEELMANTTPEEYRNALSADDFSYFQKDIGNEIIDE